MILLLTPKTSTCIFLLILLLLLLFSKVACVKCLDWSFITFITEQFNIYSEVLWIGSEESCLNVVWRRAADAIKIKHFAKQMHLSGVNVKVIKLQYCVSRTSLKCINMTFV